jgi:RNA polymerase sigma-70 factor (ECF subfamily)
VVQIVLSRASAALPEFRGESSPRGWLFSIATNAAYDWKRSHRLQQQADEPDDEFASADFEEIGQERTLLREEMSRCVSEVLRRLPESYQTVLSLSDCEELTDREIAEVLGVTVGSAKIRLHRARLRLRAELERSCSFYHDAENTLCCERKHESSEAAYRLGSEPRHQLESPVMRAEEPKEPMMTSVETLPTKQKHLVGVGVAVAVGCQPCTRSYVSAAETAGACERGIRFALEAGLSIREQAFTATREFANATFARPELDANFRNERVQLGALIAVAGALVTNAAGLLEERINAARELGASDDQIRLAVQIARTTKRGAEREVEAVLSAALGETSTSLASNTDSAVGCCEATAGSLGSSSSCGCAQP